MIASARKSVMAPAAAALVAVAVSACGGGDGDDTQTTVTNANEANSIHAATGIDLVGGDEPLALRPTDAFDSGSEYRGLYASATSTDGIDRRTARAIPWVTRNGEVHFAVGVSSGSSPSELDPLTWQGRAFETTDISDYSEDESHGLGDDWRVFDAGREYDSAGRLAVRIATDVHGAGTVERPYVGLGDFDRRIELSDIPALPANRDYQGVNVVGGVTGSLDGVPGRFSCQSGIPLCFLHILPGRAGGGYSPYGNVVFTRDDSGASEVLSGATIGQPVPTADYLVFGTWQYVPDDIAAADDYEFGVFAGGGDPFRSMDARANLHGTATYGGSAHGKYYTGRSSSAPHVGTFEGGVTLEADFGSDLDPLDSGRLGGTVDNIRYSGAPSGLPAQLILGGEGASEADIAIVAIPTGPTSTIQGMAAVGEVADGQPTPSWSGTWQAMFYGNGANPTDHPTGVAGTFGTSNDEDGLVGAFGARRQPQ